MKKRVLSGMRPTGRLHLGNYHGALENWVKMQDAYECFFFIADWHALTTDYDDTSSIKENRVEIMLDWLAAGLDPAKSTLFVQSWVKQHAELFLLLSMITPVPWLERVPTYKDQISQLNHKDLTTYGFLGYPLLQAADIIIYRPQLVPVGIDQVPHVEITREVARRFNFIFKHEVFPEPDALLTKTPKILGLDRRKMSKSYGNTIMLSDSEKEIMTKVSQMITDPERIKKTDPGHPEICNVFDFHKIYSTQAEVCEIETACRQGEIGCVACKKQVAGKLNAHLAPIRERRAYYAANLNLVEEIMRAGSDKTRAEAEETMLFVRDAIKI